MRSSEWKPVRAGQVSTFLVGLQCGLSGTCCTCAPLEHESASAGAARPQALGSSAAAEPVVRIIAMRGRRLPYFRIDVRDDDDTGACDATRAAEVFLVRTKEAYTYSGTPQAVPHPQLALAG